MAKWLAKEFDWTLRQYTGNYYDIAEAGVVAVFVCSYTGDDTAAGTSAAPFKTLSKAITTLNTTGADGSRIFMNGVFSENLPTQTYWYDFIGCGGGKNGRTLFRYDASTEIYCRFVKPGTRLHNITTVDYPKTTIFVGFYSSTVWYYFVNCIINTCRFDSNNSFSRQYAYHSIFYTVRYITTSNAQRFHFYGRFFTLYNCYAYEDGLGSTVCQNYSIDSHFYKNIDRGSGSGGLFYWYYQNTWNNAIIDLEGQYFDPANGNWGYPPTSPLLFLGTVDELTGIGSHVGGGFMGFKYDPLNIQLITEGGATLTNLEVSNGRLVRTDPNIAGSLETGSIDLGAPYPITQLTVENIFEYDTTGVSKGVFEDLTGSPRPALTILMKYGNTEAERDACPWLEVEYGKRPTYSGSAASRVGNGDDTFDSDNELTITARYFKYKFTLQDR